MPSTNTKVVTAHLPKDLAEKVDQLAERLERSRGWIVKQALYALSTGKRTPSFDVGSIG